MFRRLLRTRRKTAAVIHSLAQEIASAARQTVRQRVEERCRGMSLNELRGYARARAAQPVQCRTAQRLQSARGLSLTPDQKQLVARQATQRVVQLVVQELAGLELASEACRRAA